ncbi:hypothetical protein BGY98DRAFT_1103404 [Russula aff. rugulosa BPL654]|nr:hypothetical protein BGY98DRAFT_1103404 [Russula aff. rugulosa BPL654]
MTPSQFPIQASDILVFGFVAHMFSPEDAHNFLALLLRTQDFLRHYRMSFSQGVWFITQNPPFFPPPPPGIPPQNLMLPLDYNVATTQGTVVPQRRWTPADEIDVRRYVESATLQLPVYFVKRNGRDHDLHGDREAPLSGRATTHLRINWPGCSDWKRQIPTRDETHARNPITRARFMKHVATSVDKFLISSPLAMYEEGYKGDPNWRIGIRDITQRHVKIIGAVHVSAGSWMPIVQLTDLCFQAIPIGTPAAVREMPPEVDMLRIIGGLALALFRIPIDHRRTAEYNSNSLGTTGDTSVQTIKLYLWDRWFKHPTSASSVDLDLVHQSRRLQGPTTLLSYPCTLNNTVFASVATASLSFSLDARPYSAPSATVSQ